MMIKDVFAKSINRDIQGVIKVGQEDEQRVKQELDEYVVTHELQEQFATFFTAYEKAIQGPTDDMGVWISGFFGSGKSHFLKIISYILENRRVDGRTAVSFFKDKIADPLTYARMERAAGSNTDVILFNIDSKAMSGEKQDANVIINVFLQVFNEMQGYSNKNAWIADLERQLDQAGDYEEFKRAFKELEKNNLDWEVGRDHYSMNMGTIKETLVTQSIMSEADAQGFIDNLLLPYKINLNTFAQLVNEFCERTGKRVAFMVDEVGQFVGKSEQRMLNLQTIVEELGTATQGKAWVVVTSQQAINDVTANLNGQDFSKIQGRFKTRIAMSSANVDEVIKRRLLEKTPLAHQELAGVYEANAASLNNVIDFDDGPTRQKFTSGDEFADNYPFVPYQFQLLQQVLTAIRTHGSDGKHLSEGERSMLSIFQESAMYKEDAKEGNLIPFALFFEGLKQFLDHTHRIVIENAWNNSALNPNKESNPFVIQVLKVLFMVKYLDNFKATLNNIITLMVDNVEVDLIELKKRTQVALQDLIREGIVEKHFDEFIFLTDAEQDINTGIDRQNVNSAEITDTIQDLLFRNKVISEKYTYPKFHNRYVFGFNRSLDGKTFGKSNNDLSMEVFTPDSDYFGDETAYAGRTMRPEAFVIAMPNDRSYIDLITRSVKIKNYITINSNNQDPHFQSLLDERRSERKQLDSRAAEHLYSALEEATFYVSGALLTSNREFSAQLEEAEKAIVDNNYRQLDYIKAAKSERDITQILRDDGLVNTDENGLAVSALFERLQTMLTTNGQHITLKLILTTFSGIPYGYTDEDTEWLLAALFKQGKVKLSLNGETISLMSTEPRKVTEYLTKKSFAEKIAVQVRKEVAPRDLKRLRNIASEVFSKKTFSSDDVETVANETRTKVEQDATLIKTFDKMNRDFPGHNLLETGISLMNELLAASDTDSFVAVIGRKYDDLLDWQEDFDSTGIKDFYLSSDSQTIWADGLNDIDIYDKSRDFIADDQLAKIAEELRTVLKSNRAEGMVRQVKALDEQFDQFFSQVFDKKQADKMANVEAIRQQGADYIQRVADSQDDRVVTQYARFTSALDRILKEVKDASALDELTVTSNKAQAQYEQLTAFVEGLAPKKVEGGKGTPPNPDAGGSGELPKPPIKPEKKPIQTINAHEIIQGTQWQIKNNDDIERYLGELRQQLTNQLKNADEIDVNF